MHDLMKLLNLLSSEEKKRGMNILLLVLLLSVLETLGVASVMPFLAVLGSPELVDSNVFLNKVYTRCQSFGVGSREHFLVFLGFSSFFLIVISAIYRTFTIYLLNKFIEMRRHSFSFRLLRSFVYMPYEFFIDRHSGELSKGVLSEIDELVNNIFLSVVFMISSALVAVGILGLLIFSNPLLAFFSGLVFGGCYGLIFLAMRGTAVSLGEQMVANNEKRFLAINEIFSGIKVIKLMRNEDVFLTTFQKPSKEFARVQSFRRTINQVPQYVVEALGFGGIIAIALGLLFFSGSESKLLGEILPILGLYAFASYRLQPALRSIFQGFISLKYGGKAIDNLARDLERKGEEIKFQIDSRIPNKIVSSIELLDVSYTYPKASKSSVKNVNLTVCNGKSLGIVGKTGSGKSTLVDLMLGLLRPTTGHLLVNGKVVTEKNLISYQKSLGYVPQEIVLSDTTIAQNIAFGLSLEEIDFAKVREICDNVELSSLVFQSLPNGLNTLVGEKGVRLSGGERQRIGIARALYFDPAVLILDEATSALDNETERQIMKNMETIGKDMLMVIVAHRLTTIRNCDEIIILDNGSVSQSGSKKHLLENNPKFKLNFESYE